MKKEIAAANKIMPDESHPQLLRLLTLYSFKIEMIVLKDRRKPLGNRWALFVLGGL